MSELDEQEIIITQIPTDDEDDEQEIRIVQILTNGDGDEDKLCKTSESIEI